jgi:ribonucleoside-diphosphate reductase alpha chain
MVDHPNIKSTTSIVDFIFRCLAYEYLNRTDLVHVLDKPELGNTGTEEWDEQPASGKPELSDVRVIAPATGNSAITATSSMKVQKSTTVVKAENSTQEFMKSMQSDAPACNTCGHITVRSGTCYKCLNCGNSMGCS